jgi:hypothetical protein
MGLFIFRILLCIWYTVLCGGFAYLYWFVGIGDPRDIFGNLLSNVGALVVFPVGWIGLLISAWD